jgi:hypothetical protein
MTPDPVHAKAPPPSRLRRLGRIACSTAVFLFVCWHLFFLAFRNPLDLWWTSEARKWADEQEWWPRIKRGFKVLDNATYYYGTFFGIEQGWSMFTPPMARSAPFLAVRLDFTDGTSGELRSENEPEPANFVRIGGWRQRKLEDHLGYSEGKLEANEELPLWQAYARWSIRRWRAAHPEDQREVKRVVLLKRRIYFPAPDEKPGAYAEPEVTAVATFAPDGTLLGEGDVREKAP